ncbi:MAG: radical SAM protein [Nitrospirae bacterium]|nr:radical SAM protein [Nitrospirota bacterium]
MHFVTERCNARCGHCFLDFSNACPQDKELSIDEIRRMTRTMGSCLYNVNLTGGEPFLREDLFEIVAAYLNNTSARSIIITTNGTQVDAVESFLRKWTAESLSGRIKISISLDHHEERHDTNRRVPGAYRKALQTYRMVEELKDKRLMPDIALTVTPLNAADILEVYNELKGRGILFFSPILMRREGVVKELKDRTAVLSAYNELSSRIAEDQRHIDYPIRHRLWERTRNAKNAMLNDCLTASSSVPRSRASCRAGTLFGVIAANGDLLPCEVFGRDSRLGSLRANNMDFMSIWKSRRTDDGHGDMSCRSCTYECAWTVTIMTTPSYYPGLFRRLLKKGR